MVKINRIKQHNYTVIDNQLACDQQLSWHARGIFLYLYAHGDEWEFLEQEVIAENNARHDTFMQGIAELEAAGYLRCSKLQADNGEVLESLWELAMTPVFKNDPQIQLNFAENVAISGFSPRTGFPATDNPPLVYPPLEKPVLENPPLRSTNKTNTKYNKQQTKQSSNPGDEDGPQEMVEDACTEIIRYLNAKTGRRYNPKTITTRRLINARIQEGYQVEDFLKVIDTKVSHWLNDEKWAMYLRPGTLFGTKFDNYINEAPKRSNNAI